MTPERFSPCDDVAELLLPHATGGDDASHDLSHIHRVWRHALAIRAEEGGNLRIIAAAVLMHDSVNLEKNDPDRARASTLSAEKASSILADAGWDADDIEQVTHAIAAHSFSANIAPVTLEARIVQDADRLDSLGMVGVARCFHVAGRLGRPLYEPGDPSASNRPLDDRAWTLDHFPAKILKLADGFNTATGRRHAERAHASVRRFLDEMLWEIGG